MNQSSSLHPVQFFPKAAVDCWDIFELQSYRVTELQSYRVTELQRHWLRFRWRVPASNSCSIFLSNS